MSMEPKRHRHMQHLKKKKKEEEQNISATTTVKVNPILNIFSV